jgi:VIT family
MREPCPWLRVSMFPPVLIQTPGQADLNREPAEPDDNVEDEKESFTHIRTTGARYDSYRTSCRTLMAKDTLAAHARDELRISEIVRARPVQAAIVSALSFAIGAGVTFTSNSYRACYRPCVTCGRDFSILSRTSGQTGGLYWRRVHPEENGACHILGSPGNGNHRRIGALFGATV